MSAQGRGSSEVNAAIDERQGRSGALHGGGDELWARAAFAVEQDADLLVSVHDNAFADGVDPFENVGTEVYYYHALSEPFARALQQALVPVTGLPDLGAKQRSLALVRPS